MGASLSGAVMANGLPDIVQFNPVGSIMQGQQFAQQRADAAQQNQLRTMQMQQAQDTQGRDAQFRNELAAYLQGGSTNLAAMYQADPERAMQVQQFQNQQNQLARQKQIDQAKQQYASAQYVINSAAPKTLAETQFPQYIEHLKAQGVDWNKITDEQVKQMAEQISAQSGSLAGVVPDKVSADKAAELKASSAAQEDRQTFEAEQKRLDRAAEANKTTRTANIPFQNASTLRKEYDAQSVEFQKATQGYQSVLAAAKDPSAAGDLALIFNYMKTLDPGSTVREGEFANAQNAGGIPTRIIAQYNKIMSGERLAPEQRKDFVTKAGQLYQGHRTLDDKRREKYSTLATRNDLDPADVVGEQVRVDIPVDVLGVGQSTQLNGFTIKRKK
jgi:hypothetical protein